MAQARTLALPSIQTFWNAGTAAWKTGRAGVVGGNHDWVEVYDQGVWSFTGQPPVPIFWFYSAICDSNVCIEILGQHIGMVEDFLTELLAWAPTDPSEFCRAVGMDC